MTSIFLKMKDNLQIEDVMGQEAASQIIKLNLQSSDCAIKYLKIYGPLLFPPNAYL